MGNDTIFGNNTVTTDYDFWFKTDTQGNIINTEILPDGQQPTSANDYLFFEDDPRTPWGGHFENGEWVANPAPPPPEPYVVPLSFLKEIKWNEIKAKRDSEERSPLPYMNKLLDFDSISSERLAWAIDAARSAVGAGMAFTVNWTCYDNSILVMTEAEILQIPLVVAQRSDTLHAKARDLKLQIDLATTEEELKLISWDEPVTPAVSLPETPIVTGNDTVVI